MQVIRKNFSYLYHIFRMVFSSSSRFFLSVCGLFIGILILTVGSIFMDSYYNKFLEDADEFVDNSVMLKLDSPADFKKKVVNEINEKKVGNIIISDEEECIYVKEYSNRHYCVLNAKRIGATKMTDGIVCYNYSEDGVIPVRGELLYGRWLGQKDSIEKRHVVVIDSFTAELLFGTENAVGKYLKTNQSQLGTATISENGENTGTDGTEYEIVGVFRNARLTAGNELEMKKFLRRGEKTLYLETYIYVPRLLLDEESSSNSGMEYYYWNCATGEEYNRVLSSLNDFRAVYSGRYYRFDTKTKEDILKEVKSELRPIKIFFALLLCVLLVISGINTMSTMFFAVKERICEIGIKKAMGATKMDIAIQFLLEGLVMALVASIAAMVSAIFTSGVLGDAMESVLFIRLRIVYEWNTFLISLVVAAIYGLIFSFLPSYYGASINVTDALRFD
ncbi:MAG: ABC transporter permease [Lachnospiraceae bacterium]|nr:ABC transporter permease [Lachnospiraceae bacterium]